MDRRSTLATLFGQSKSDSINSLAAPVVTTVASGLDPYNGPFEFEQAAHLLRRTTFGPTYQQIKEAVNNGLETTLNTLLADIPMPSLPVNHTFTQDPEVPVGETWVNKAYQPGDLLQPIRNYRRQSLYAWTVEIWRKTGMNIREKMTLFWHNHYVTAGINDPNYVFLYIDLLRQNATGNFRELTKKVTVDPSMLIYLNGNQNAAAAPNENYSRELLELFTIGKGPVAGPGDYTNYTEDDVVEMARVLTGWRNFGAFTLDPEENEPGSDYVDNRHDSGTKQLSHRFENIVIPNLEKEEYAHLIDVIFAKEECARFMCRKLYRWFVYYDIPPDIEVNVIEPMAQLMIDNDYEVKPVLEALLNSEHFFDILSIGPMIRNPIDFLLTVLNTYEVEYNESNLNLYYRLMAATVRDPLELMQMQMYNPPSVAGWKAYYQEPSFYRTWISSATLAPRMQFTNRMLYEGYGDGDFTAKIDVLKFTASLDNPFDPNTLIDEFSRILYPQPITQEQKDLLKTILIPGLPDFEWTIEYSDYVNDPDNQDLESAVSSKLRNLLGAMMSMPEFYLS